MNTNNLLKNDFSIVFDEVKQFDGVELLSNEEMIANEDIRNLGQICKELNNNLQGNFIYRTFS
ncbi:hypothetical protein AGMMS4957_13280 [Bacteroidia bacterium]|nr:hypothetical protein AGMMS4957_13280 [Bacteroidia bacterium]